MDTETFFPTGAAARQLGVSRDRVQQLCDSGVLKHVRDVSGRRLISSKEVERLRRQREQAARQPSATS